MAYYATMPVRFDKDYAVGNFIPDGVVSPATEKRLIGLGRIRKASAEEVKAAKASGKKKKAAEPPAPPEKPSAPPEGDSPESGFAEQ